MKLQDVFIGKIVRVSTADSFQSGTKVTDKIGHVVGLGRNSSGETLYTIKFDDGGQRKFHPTYVHEPAYEVVLDLKSSEHECTRSLGVYSTRAEAELIGKTWMGKGCYPQRGETGKVYRVVDARVI